MTTPLQLNDARLQLDQWEPDAAIALYETCLSASPEESTEAAFGIGLIEVLRFNPEGAITALSPRLSTDIQPYSTLIPLLLGYAYNYIDNKAESEACFRIHADRVNSTPPWNPFNDAATYYRKYILFNTDVLWNWIFYLTRNEQGGRISLDLIKWNDLVFTVVQAGVSEQREANYREMADAFLNMAYTMDGAYAGDAFLRKGDWLIGKNIDAAYVEYRKAVSAAPENYYAHQTFGSNLLRTKHYVEAAHHLGRSMEIAINLNMTLSSQYLMTCAAAFTLGAQELVLQQDYSGAEQLYRKMMAINRHDVEIGPLPEDLWMKLSDSYYYKHLAINRDEKREEVALKFVEIAIAMSPSPTNLGRRSILLCELGRYEEALQTVEPAFSVFPDNYYLHYARACALARLSDLPGAYADVKRSLELNPGFKNNLRYATDFVKHSDDPEFIAIFRIA